MQLGLDDRALQIVGVGGQWAGAAYTGTPALSLVDTDFEALVDSASRGLIFIRSNGSMVNGVVQNCYLFQAVRQGVTNQWKVNMMKNLAGAGTNLSTQPTITLDCTIFKLRLTAQGGTLNGYVNGNLLIGPVVDGSPLGAGTVGLAAFSGTALYDNLKVNSTILCGP